MENNLNPFRYMVHENNETASLMLTNFDEKGYIFDEKSEEGWEGGGYDWASLAQVVLDEQSPELKEEVHFDPEADMFVAYGNKDVILTFAKVLKKAYDDDSVLRDALARAELD